MIQKITLTKIWIDKTPTQYGSFKTNFKCTEYGDRWISGFAKEFNHKEGEIVELDVHENEKGTKDKDGKVYMNWKFPNKDSAVNDRLAKIEFSIANIHRKIEQIVAEVKRLDPKNSLTSASTEVPTFIPNTPEKAQDFGNKMGAYEAKTFPKSELESLDEMATSIYENM